MSGDHNMYCSGNQPDDELFNLAEQHGVYSDTNWKGIEAFYRAAYNKALEVAAKRVEVWDTSFQTGGSFAAAIRALKEEV